MRKKGEFRRLWIQRINAASRANGLTYNRLIQGLGLAGIEVDRRILADLAVNEPATFAALVKTAKNALPPTRRHRRPAPRRKLASLSIHDRARIAGPQPHRFRAAALRARF